MTSQINQKDEDCSGSLCLTALTTIQPVQLPSNRHTRYSNHGSLVPALINLPPQKPTPEKKSHPSTPNPLHPLTNIQTLSNASHSSNNPLKFHNLWTDGAFHLIGAHNKVSQMNWKLIVFLSPLQPYTPSIYPHHQSRLPSDLPPSWVSTAWIPS